MVDSDAAPVSIDAVLRVSDALAPAAGRREWRAFAALFAVALLLFGFVAATVHRHAPERFATVPYAVRARYGAEQWLANGMLASGGLLVRPDANGAPTIYRSSTGAVLWPAYLVQTSRVALGATPDWRWFALANLAFALLTSLLLAWLGYRLARRLAVPSSPAVIGAAAFLAVHFTFPDNLMTYWEMSGRLPFLCVAAVFLLVDARRTDGARRLDAWQAAAAFSLTFAELFSGAFFLIAWTLVSLLVEEGASRVRRVLVLGLLPAALAFGVHQAQLAWAQTLQPQMPVDGSTLAFRTGLDGDTIFYRDHVDLVIGRRPSVEAYRTEAPAGVFRTPGLFLSGSVMLLILLGLALRGRVPRAVTVALFSLFGGYVLQAAVFSQAIAIHPYYYDVLLYTPFALALFVLAPALLRRVVAQPGLALCVAVLCAVWVSFAQLRVYAVAFPP